MAVPIDPPRGFGQFLSSALSAGTRELIGLDPSLETQLYRAGSPTGGTISEIAGFLVPGLGTAKLTSKIPAMSRALQAVGNAERMAAAPFVTRAQVEALRFAPFEIGRTFGSLAFGDNPDKIAGEAVTNLAITAGVGGLIGKFQSAARPMQGGKTDIGKISEVVPGFDSAAPAQVRTQALIKARAEMPQEAELFGRVIRANTEEVFLQEPEKKAVLSIMGDKEATRSVNRLFKVFGEKDEQLRARKFDLSDKGFKSVTERSDLLMRAGIGDVDDFAGSVLYPRVLTGTSEKQAKTLERNFKGGFWSQADDWLYVREDGGNKMVVMAKKIRGTPGTAAKDDQWMVFKTGMPEKFAPSVDAGVKNMESIWGRVWPARLDTEIDELGKNSKLYQGIKASDEIMGGEASMKAFASVEKEAESGVISKMTKLLSNGPFGVRPGSVVMDKTGRLGQMIKEYFVPTEFQLAASPRARGIFGLAKQAKDLAMAEAHTLFYGTTKALNTPAKYIRNIPQRGGIDVELDKILHNKVDIRNLQQALVRNIPVAEAEAMGMSPAVISTLKSLKMADDISNAEIDAALKIAGVEGGYKPMANHYLFTRTWRGDHRAEVITGLEGPGQRIWIAGGRTPQEAKQVAKAFADEMSSRGHPVRVGKEWTKGDSSHDLAEAARIVQDKRIARIVDEAQEATLKKTWAPQFTKERTGGGGFIGDVGELQVKEIREIVLGQLEAKMKYAAELIYNQRVAGQVQKLAAENPNLGAIVSDRIGAVWGKQGELSKVINSVADKHLSGLMGGQSATKIAQKVNGGMFHLSFGFGNVQFPVLNAMTMIMNGPAELALLQKGAPQQILKYYNMVPVIGADGLPRGATGMVDNLRIMRDGFRQLGSPDPALAKAMQKAALEGVVSPRLAEEMVGQNSKMATNLRGVLKGEQGVVSLISELSKALPTMSEKFSRIWAFNIGYLTAKRVFGLTDEDRIYQVAKRFTERTNYSYTAADRAKTMTGPIGSVFGLYKNWMMHYLGNWMVYADSAISHNNWKPLLWATGTAWATGGALGAGPVSMLVDGAARIFGNKDSTAESLYDWFGGRGTASDAAMYGLPGLFGLSLVSSGSAPGSEVIRDMGFLTNLAVMDRAKAAGKFLGNVGENLAAGQPLRSTPLLTENFYRAFAPRSIYRGLAVLEDENLRSLQTGTPLVKDLSFAHRSLYTMGLNPIEVDNTLMLGREIWKDNERMKLQVEWLGRRWEEAQRVGDWNEMNKVMGQSTGLGIMDKVLHSVQSRSSRQQKDLISSRGGSPEIDARRRNLGIGN